MDLQAVGPLLGAAADDPRVVALLQRLGGAVQPKLKQGDTKVNVDIPSVGIYFVFTDEAFLYKTPGGKIGAGSLLLTNATVYCVPNGRFQAFAGALPFGVRSSSGRDALRSQLGEPQASLDRRRLDRWTIDGLWVFVQYETDLKSVNNISIQIPDA